MLVGRRPRRARLQEHCPMRPSKWKNSESAILRMLFPVLTLLLLADIAQAQKQATADKPRIRAITAFINLDRAQYQLQVADALKMLRRAQTTFESRGYQVQTIRIATQPFPEYTKGLTKEQAIGFFKQ